MSNSVAAQEAKQLDSVTDRVQEKELDESKAMEAMKSFQAVNLVSTDETKAVAVLKEDVLLIVSELEVSEEVATKALREVGQGPNAVVDALRLLITS